MYDLLTVCPKVCVCVVSLILFVVDTCAVFPPVKAYARVACTGGDGKLPCKIDDTVYVLKVRIFIRVSSWTYLTVISVSHDVELCLTLSECVGMCSLLCVMCVAHPV